MAAFRVRGGKTVDFQVGDDVHLAVVDPTMEGGLRAITGQVTDLDATGNALWVRGVRVDMADAEVESHIDTDDPANLTPAPDPADAG